MNYLNNIKILLWDIDGTILNFLEAEKAAIRTGFKRLNMGECTDEMLKHYSSINKEYWQRLERGEMTKPQILVGRFKDFFTAYNLDVELAEEFNSNYQVDLGDTICFNDNAFEIISDWKHKYKQYAVTNGTAIAQYKKLAASGLDKIFDAVFISEEVGFEKPSKSYFDLVFEKIRLDCGDFDNEEVMIIGDSLTSDIKGGNNAGIPTCWYNPEGIKTDFDGKIDITISNLNDLRKIL